MKKPVNFDETRGATEFTPIEVGGHTMMIVGVQERKNRNGGDMVVVAVDTDKSDKQPQYFLDMFNSDDREDKKWPYQGTMYINVEDSQGKCSRSFKSFCESVERSNNGFKISWEADFGTQFKGKKIGGVYGLVENEFNGKVTMRPQLRWFCQYEKAADAKVPEAKYLKTPANVSGPAPIPVSNSVYDEDVPF